MKVASHQLEAFYQTSKMRSFSKAAAALGVTQSALSQRIGNLEDDLEVSLFIRDPGGPILTAAGELLLRYCQVNDALEIDLISQLKSSSDELRGVIRIAAFSSVLRSAIIPSLAPFLRAHPKVQCEFRSYEISDLYTALRNVEADLVVLDYHLEKTGIVEHVLGKEEYVVIDSSKYTTEANLYLDHAPQDNATERYFQEQSKTPESLRRSFMGDIYGIIDAVEQGLGRAVMSKHLIKGNTRVQQLKGYQRYIRPVTLNYYEQPYYSRLQKEVVSQLIKNVGSHL